MPPTVILIRHGQALHNVSDKTSRLTCPIQEYDIHDPELSKLGRQQCCDLESHLRQHLPLAEKIDTIITSPMIRTVETTLLGLDWLIKRGVPVETDALWQENSSKPCDTGSDVSRLKTLFPTVDFSTVDPVWPSKSMETPYAFTKEIVLARGQTCLKNLYSRKEKVIAVVSHAGFLRCAVSHTRYQNADFRIFGFAEDSTPSCPNLIEWDLTSERGGGMGLSEKGRAEIVERDFPTDTVEKVEQKSGGKEDGEAVSEIP